MLAEPPRSSTTAMKTVSPCLSLLILLLLEVMIHHPSHSISDTQLKSICSETYSVDYCVTVLKADPRTASADLDGLLHVAIDLTQSKAYSGLSLVQSLEGNASDPALKQQLHYCSELYTMGRSLINRAKQSLELKNYENVMQRAISANDVYESCEDEFDGPPVMPDQLQPVNDDLGNLTIIVFLVAGKL